MMVWFLIFLCRLYVEVIFFFFKDLGKKQNKAPPGDSVFFPLDRVFFFPPRFWLLLEVMFVANVWVAFGPGFLQAGWFFKAPGNAVPGELSPGMCHLPVIRGRYV